MSGNNVGRVLSPAPYGPSLSANKIMSESDNGWPGGEALTEAWFKQSRICYFNATTCHVHCLCHVSYDLLLTLVLLATTATTLTTVSATITSRT